MARRLAKIAEHINTNPQLGLRAAIEKGHCSTDRQLAGSRLRIPGKGRWGTRLKAWVVKTNELVLDHNSAETYRTNQEVEDWLTAWERGDRRRWSAFGNRIDE